MIAPLLLPGNHVTATVSKDPVTFGSTFAEPFRPTRVKDSLPFFNYFLDGSISKTSKKLRPLGTPALAIDCKTVELWCVALMPSSESHVAAITTA